MANSRLIESLMRTPIVLLAGLLIFSHAFAADNLIRLSEPLKLDLPIKEGNVVSSDAVSGNTEPESDEDDPNMSEEDRAQKRLAAIIKARLTALRARQDKNPTAYSSRYATKKEKEKPVVYSHWSYEGEAGPEYWGKRNPAWAQCGAGNRQSPIDIREGIKVNLEPVRFEYKPANFIVTNNGHSVQVDLDPGSQITLTGRSYDLVQFHFHLPSEERINGKGFPMVVHLVHRSEDGKLAVVALLVEEGVANGVVQKAWNNLPLEKNEPVMPNSMIDATQLLPMSREYYTYMGSLTTPPCTEGVLWIVMKQPIHLSADQIAIFARLYPMNARPLQASAGRMIKESN